MVCETEEAFFFLVEKAEAQIGGERLDRVIEAPDRSGQAVFGFASIWSEKIAAWILDREIDVAFDDALWMTAQFIFPTLVEKMARKGINPFIVKYTGKSEYEDRPRNFENLDEELLKPFLLGEICEEKTAVSYSFVDSNCGDKCGNSCGNQMRKFKIYTGRKIFENEKRGGEGIVGFGKWHGEEAAFKKLEMEEIETVEDTSEAILNAEKTRAEFEVTSKLRNENIVRVIHLFRYQETEKFGKSRFTQNWTVIVMEKHSKNIGELNFEERLAIPTLLRDTLGSGCYTFYYILNEKIIKKSIFLRSGLFSDDLLLWDLVGLSSFTN